jgi:hypothetical protein
VAQGIGPEFKPQYCKKKKRKKERKKRYFQRLEWIMGGKPEFTERGSH